MKALLERYICGGIFPAVLSGVINRKITSELELYINFVLCGKTKQ